MNENSWIIRIGRYPVILYDSATTSDASFLGYTHLFIMRRKNWRKSQTRIISILLFLFY